MKKGLGVLFFLLVGITVFCYHEEIVSYLVNTLSNYGKDSSSLTNNHYAGNSNYQFVQLTNQFTPMNRKDIINIYYTVLNSGMEDFTFYCPKTYENCIEEVNQISNDQLLLSNINNFVPVYNSFQNMETEFDTLGKVTIHITHNYTEEDINILNQTIQSIMQETITEEMTPQDKIKAIHDYIIDHTRYDVNRSDHQITTYRSDTAYGALIEHYAICGGYADSMKLFLEELKIPSYKISSENHVWNFLLLDGNWYHLDLTWDDPISSTPEEDLLEYDYFLITTEQLKSLEGKQHLFDETIYQEAK